MKAIGRHIILEMWRCSGLSLNSMETAEQALRDMVAALDVNLLDLKVYPFSPVGVTGIAIVSESHLVIHTWPEHGYAAVDIFTCGAPRDPQAAIDVLRQHFQPEHVQVMEINRGQLDLPDSAPPEVKGPVKTSKSPRAHGRARAPALSA
jgi:S-adenosylmethionine decarboxylase